MIKVGVRWKSLWPGDRVQDQGQTERLVSVSGSSLGLGSASDLGSGSRLGNVRGQLQV